MIPENPSAGDLAEFELGAEMDGGAAESQRRGVEESDRRKSELVELDGRGRLRRRPAVEGGTLRASERESVGKSEDEQDMAAVKLWLWLKGRFGLSSVIRRRSPK